MRILFVEDNLELSGWLARLLRKSKYVVDCVDNGADADAILTTQSYDLVILDLGLPEMDGLEVLKRFRSRRALTPLIILSANDALTCRVAALDNGADDYVVKPFDINDLEARIRARLRDRVGAKTSSVSLGSLEFHSSSREFFLLGEPFILTKREHATLETLLMAAGRIVPKDFLVETVFGLDDDAQPNAIEIYVHRVRKKLEASGLGITAFRGLGYSLREQNG